MKSSDLTRQRDSIRAKMMESFREESAEKFYQSFDEMCDVIAQSVRDDYEDSISALREEIDTRVLASRGVRQLTTDERDYYNKVMQAMRSSDPKQALSGVDNVMPKTIIDSVFEDLRTKHPLLSRIKFMPTAGAIELLLNTNGENRAVWGELCAKIGEEISSGFKLINMSLFKLSALLPVCKAMLDLGPEWLDRYVREVLSEALANGLEYGIVTGDGKNSPIGMDRQVGDGVTVTDGVYPKKAAITVSDFEPATIGNLIANMALAPNGGTREVSDVILVVNPQDYFSKIMPATTVLAPDGTYRNNILPYPIEIIQSGALQRGESVIGIGKRYFLGAGTAKEGKIEYSDHVRFIEDERVYVIKLYGNGLALDNNSFFRLDISNLAPIEHKVAVIDERAPSSDTTLASLKIGSLSLSPAFSATTKTYTASTTNASNVIQAVAANAGASVSIKVGDNDIDNGTSATWAVGSNTVTITVTAEDGTTTATYTVTVTKS